ncbi:hypothetical protein M3Y94_00294500 [Aphelenchoides besseyi]|nr:hypothetical protein M3Y94_00294500 [Aphelenchoides besseyi]
MDVPSEDADLQAPRLMDNLIRQYANQSDDIAAFLCKNKHDVNVLRDLYCGDFPRSRNFRMDSFQCFDSRSIDWECNCYVSHCTCSGNDFRYCVLTKTPIISGNASHFQYIPLQHCSCGFF